MAQEGDDDEEVNDLISHFEMLTHQQMKQALDIAKVTLKNNRRELSSIRRRRTFLNKILQDNLKAEKEDKVCGEE